MQSAAEEFTHASHCKLFIPSEKPWFAPNSGQKATEAMKGKLSFMSRPRYEPADRSPVGARLCASGGTADGAARASRKTIKHRSPEAESRLLRHLPVLANHKHHSGILESLINLVCMFMDCGRPCLSRNQTQSLRGMSLTTSSMFIFYLCLPSAELSSWCSCFL